MLKEVKNSLIGWADMKAGQINSGMVTEKPEPVKEEKKEDKTEEPNSGEA